jgi:hypothetical protein
MSASLYLSLVYGLFLVEIAIFPLISKRRRICSSLSFVLLMALLAFKIGEAVYEGVAERSFFIPFEYSHLAYFLVPFLALLGFPRLRYSVGAFSFLVGLGYIVGDAWGYQDTLTFAMYVIIRGLLVHEALFFVGLLELFSISRFLYSDYWWFLLLGAAMSVYLALVCYGVIFPSAAAGANPFSFSLLTGGVGVYIFGRSNLSLFERVFSSSLIVMLLLGASFLALWLNRLVFSHRKKADPSYDLALPLSQDLGLFPFFSDLRHRHQKKKRTGFLSD